MLKFSKANAKLEQLYNVPDELRYWLMIVARFTASIFSAGGLVHKPKIVYPKLSYQISKKARSKTAKIVKFRCFSASQEATFPNAYNNRKANFDGLRFANRPTIKLMLLLTLCPTILASAGFMLLVISSIKSISERGILSQNGIQHDCSTLTRNR